MRGTLRQTERAPSICLRCFLRLEYRHNAVFATAPASRRQLNTSRTNSQPAASAAQLVEETEDHPQQPQGAEPSEASSRTPALGQASISRRPLIQWGQRVAQKPGGLTVQEKRARASELPEGVNFAGKPLGKTDDTIRFERSTRSTGRDYFANDQVPRKKADLIRFTFSKEHSAVRRDNAGEVETREPLQLEGRLRQDRQRSTQEVGRWRPNALDNVLHNSNTRLSQDRRSLDRETNVRDWMHVRSRPEANTTNAKISEQLAPLQRGYREQLSEIRERPHSQNPPAAVANQELDFVPRRRRDEARDRDAAHRQRRTASQRSRNAYAEDLDEDSAERIDRQRRRKKGRNARKQEVSLVPVVLPDFISVGNLAGALKVRVEAFVGKLSDLGFEEVTSDHIIDAETAGLVASEFGYEPILPHKESGEDLTAQPEPEDKTFLLNRPPVVTIMGHVDHGKTTLLDWLRKSSVAASEHGGITQHIGAFTVPMQSGRVITFLDTPGHAAFLAMRARGTNVTDIVILVVAADDSVKPQTIEAIKHAKEAKVPVIVAISKVDKPDADARRVKQDLARYGIEVEDIGGDVQAVEVSGKTGQGMGDLEEATLALADILDIRASTDGQVEGWVLESSAGKAGKTATVLVRRGTLTPGTLLVAGTTWTRVRTLRDERGEVLDSAGPGVPVLVDGWRDQPNAGDEALQAGSEQNAKDAIDFRRSRAEGDRMAQDVSVANQARTASAALEAAAKEAEEKGEVEDAEEYTAAQKKREENSGVPEVPMVLRADVSGSAEALDAYIQSIPTPLIRPNILRSRVGQITSSDINLAQSTSGALVAFNIDIPGPMAVQAERAGVKIISGNIIYKIIEEVKTLMEDQLPDLITTRVLGEAAVLEVFEIDIASRKKLKVAGCRIGNGLMKKGGRVRVIRGSNEDDGLTSDLGAGRKGAHKVVEGAENEETTEEGERIVYTGILSTLKHHKKDVAEMRKGSECGLSLDGGFAEFEAGDRVQHFEEIRERRKL